MQLKSFKLYQNCVDLFMADGKMLRLWLNEWSGKIVFRYKINTISNVKHPGIVLGYDEAGVWYYMHNHFENGRPAIEQQIGFAKGQQVYTEQRQSDFGSLALIERGLNEIIAAKPYAWLGYNCQVFVNRVCFNENKSETVENWTGGLALGLLVLLGVSAFRNSK
jgi:hypothetical protein